MSGGYTHHAIFVGDRMHPREQDTNSAYPLLLKPSGQDARYLYFAMQAPPIIIVGGWQLKKPEERAS